MTITTDVVRAGGRVSAPTALSAQATFGVDDNGNRVKLPTS